MKPNAKEKLEVWFCVAIIMQIYTNRRHCSSIIGTQLCCLFIKWERQSNEQCSSTLKSPYVETDFRVVGGFPFATIYFMMIKEEKGNANGQAMCSMFSNTVGFKAWKTMGLSGDSPCSVQAQAKEALHELLEKVRFFPLIWTQSCQPH